MGACELTSEMEEENDDFEDEFIAVTKRKIEMPRCPTLPPSSHHVVHSTFSGREAII